MAKTAKERIEEEIKDVNRSSVYSLDRNGRAFDSGKRQGLAIALAHVENSPECNQPKLSIPKKIAEELDGFNPNEGETKIELLIVGYYKSFLSDELMSFCLANNGLNLCAFYLAGKALGVELVEVER